MCTQAGTDVTAYHPGLPGMSAIPEQIKPILRDTRAKNVPRNCRWCPGLLSNRMQGNGGGGRGTTSHYMQLNRHILDCGSTGELCELIEAMRQG